MTERMTLSEAFAHFGAHPANPRWSWSARTADGAVVLTLWQDKFVGRNGELRYEQAAYPPGVPERPGARALIADLAHARDQMDGVVRAVLCIARDVHADPRSIRDCAPYPHLMRVVELDVATGAFTLARPLKPKG